jgi:hypothetical protein
MTSPKMISFAVGVFLLGLVLSFIMSGVWFDNATKTIFDSLTIMKSYNILGFHLPWINFEFFTKGLPHLLSFNFAFFGGSANFFKYGMYVFSIGIIWGIVTFFIGIILNFFGSRLRI